MLLADGAPLFETAIPFGVFGVDRSDAAGLSFTVIPVAATRRARMTAGLAVGGLQPLSAIAEAGVVVVPSWPDPDRRPPVSVTRQLRTCGEDGAIIIGLCVGAFVLAAAGLLDGKRATTHWRRADQLQAMYPLVDVQPDALYVDQGQIITSAGTAAGLDACLHLIRREHGATAATAIARRMVVAPHRAGNQNQFIEPAPTNLDNLNDLQGLQAWMLANLNQHITVDQLAARANLSRRSLDRHFRKTTGTSPVQWLLHQRIQAAQQLLETTDLHIDTIARRVGFTTAIALRPHFKRALGISPRTYRQSFRQGNRSTGQLN